MVDYFGGITELSDHYDHEVSNTLGEIPTLTCTPTNSTSDGQEKFVCVRYNYIFEILTLLFIYLPSVNVIATLYGPFKVGIIGTVVGLVILVPGVIMSIITGSVPSNPGLAFAAWSMLLFGCGIGITGFINLTANGEEQGDVKVDIYHILLFIPLFACSPVIFIFIKMVAIIKGSNEFIQSQATYGSRGEAILEAAPQFALQLYIILLSMSATEKQWTSVITSAATLALPCIEKYCSERDKKFGFKPIIKNVLVLLPAAMFKVLPVSILSVFFNGMTILLVIMICALEAAALGILHYFYDIPFQLSQFAECICLSCLTVASLGQSKTAAVYRLWSTLYITIFYSLLLGIIMVICKVDPSAGYVVDVGHWSDLELVKEPFFMNLLLGGTIGLGWISFLLDFILAWCKWAIGVTLDGDNKEGLWDRAILLEGLKIKLK